MLRSWKFWAAFILLAVLLWLVETTWGWGAVIQSWESIPPSAVAIAMLLMLASYLLRALRFYDFFYSNCRGHFLRLTRITVLHNFFNNLMPMRSGEAAFPMLMKSHFNSPLRHTIPALLWLRLLDLYALLVLAGISLQAHMGWSPEIRIGLGIVAVLIPLLILPVQNRINLFLKQHPSPKLNKAVELMSALPASPWPLVRALLWTFVNWALKVAVFSWLLQQFIPISFYQAWIGASTGELSSVLPVNGVAGAGTYEAGIVAGLLPWKIAATDALAAAVNLHLFVLGSTLILTALIAVATLNVRKPPQH
ncbi:lysylphosphatidylglycerol synthase transmembrane domain-containing protein [Parathalassolituus penaei]|uniref:Lysylphosphatidylglycerol synthase transmembrane domain-containing protein n=1 Tax=Parathalassolituus penaei TaxID=2997323 RepID=A0A9X3EG23_9GAMM|nr:lysylphosphatidylglycerol synthase transmembrane domain-containing protein [Parathalassolituus penaei]MCY0966570.1 lysylphosphatidylglycerol synthase transmembrane domain-containing protein [Parathalassolituus penaei]